MKKLLFLVAALLLFAMIGSPNARADSYTPTFSCTANGLSDFGCYFIPNGYTAPNVSFPSPTLQVTVGNFVYDVTLPAGDSPTDTYSWSFADSEQPLPPPGHFDEYGGLTIKDVTIGTTDSAVNQINTDVVPGDDVGEGTLSFSAVTAATPEPTPIILTLLGAGIIFLFRKRLPLRSLRAT